ncbi:hypothetical protein ACFOVU_21680 [Nocardiopsis sediminis]|uniref:Helix-turn-helix domain-containing protein n=1 Tax=Nocardiopsis sediminis TaxID=1778267 RepID=A0ABV8FV89_9ACTN
MEAPDAPRVRAAKMAVNIARNKLARQRTRLSELKRECEYLEPGAARSRRSAAALADVRSAMAVAERRHEEALRDCRNAESELSDALGKQNDLVQRHRAMPAQPSEGNGWEVTGGPPEQAEVVVADTSTSRGADAQIVGENQVSDPVAEAGAPHSRSRPPAVVEDAEGFDTSPDPMRAHSPVEFIAALDELRSWAGTPSYRAMAQRGGCSAAWLCGVLKKEELPSQKQVIAFVVGCGVSEQVVRRWISAWRLLNIAERSGVRSRDQDAPKREGSGSDNPADPASVIRLRSRTG